MSLFHSQWNVSRTSASLVWEISKQLKVFSCFFLPNFDLLLFYLMERTASATYNILQANWVVFGWFFFLINLRKNCHFFSNSFVGICYIYLENSVLNFYFGFDIEKKRYPFIFLHISLYLSYKISHHLLNALELEYASFYYCRKWSTKKFVVKNWYSI